MIPLYKRFLICSFIGLITKAHGQPIVYDWAIGFGGTGGSQAARSVVVDLNGNVYTTGSFGGVSDFDPGPGVATLTAQGSTDIFVQKVDATGAFQWVQQIATTGGGDAGRGIALDAAGNIYITGNFSGTADFDPGAGTATATAVGSRDIFIWKSNASGSLQWYAAIGGASNDGGTSIYVQNQDVYVTGDFFGSGIDFDPGAPVTTLNAYGAQDIFMAKFSTTGTFAWANSMGGSSNDEGLGIAVSSSGDIYTTGSFMTTTDFDAGAATHTVTTNGGQDVFVTKYSPTGSFVWAKTFGGTFNDVGTSVKVDAAGDVYTTGSFYDVPDFDTGPGTFTVMSAGNADCFIHRLNSAGNFQWVKTFGGSMGNDQSQSLSLDGAGNIYTTGSFQYNVDFDPNPGTFILTAAASEEVFVSKLDNLGNLVWAGNFAGTTFNSIGWAITTNTASTIYVAGQFRETVDFDPGVNSYTLVATNNTDAFVVKLSLCIPPAAPTNTTSAVFRSICEGNSTNLSATGSGTVNWYSSATGSTAVGTGSMLTTATLSPGTYTYYADANTCTMSIVRTPVTVTVHPIPEVSVSSTGSMICSGESATLAASLSNVSTGSYSWSTSSSSQSIVISPTMTTTYTVSVAAMGCTSSTTFVQNVDLCTGIRKSSISHHHVSPNPFKDIITVSVPATFFHIKISDALGREIKTLDNASGRKEVDLSQMPAGIYIVKVYSNNEMTIHKLIKD